MPYLREPNKLGDMFAHVKLTLPDALTNQGVDESAAETILHLRRLVIELQSHTRQLEAELAARYKSESRNLARYHEVYYEATWIEVEFQE